MNLGEWLHEHYGFERRVRVLSEQISGLLPPKASVLDVGCGDGGIDQLILARRPDVTIEGIDVLVRPNAKIPVTEFDGLEIPFPDDSFDGVSFVDVLHHSDDAVALLREARRVARRFIVIKDHRLEGWLAGPTLRFMDDVGNARFGVRLPYNYWRHDEWLAAFAKLGLRVASWNQRLSIYPWPADWVFGRGLHYVARLEFDPSEVAATSDAGAA